MVCSNQMLKASLDDLKTVVKENTAEQKATGKEHQETRSSLDRLSTKFETWQETKCGAHETKIFNLEEKVAGHEADMNKTLGKFAGIMGTIVLFIQITGLWFTYLRINGG